MTVPGNIDALLLGGQRGYQIERSLRFNSADSAYLSKIVGAGGGTTKNAVSFWVKRSALGTQQALFQARQDANNQQYIGFTTSNAIELGIFASGSYVLQKITSAVYRDASAWYHVFFYQDNTLATAEDRYQLYINGVRVTAWSTNTNTATQSNAYYFGSNVQHYIAAFGGASTLDGYLTEFHFIYQPTTTPLVGDFGETDTITGVWKPKRYAGTYGTNGFFLKFADNSGTTSTTLGKDSSGNSNNWTPNNFSVTAGAGNDSLIDTPTPYADGGNGRGNYATLNPIDTGGPTPSNGNLDISWSSANWRTIRCTQGITTGKWYWEFTVTSTVDSNNTHGIGIATSNAGISNYLGADANGWAYTTHSGNKANNGTNTAYGNTVANTDVVGVAFDATNGKLFFAKNNTWQASGDPAAGTNAAFTGLTSGPYLPAIGLYGNSVASGNFNFGQRAFAYTPPSGFLALNTQNLPEPSIKKPSSYFDTLIYTGDGSTTRSITGLSFSPDLLWHKSRSSADDHRLMDSVRAGGTDLSSKTLFSNLTSAEDTSGSGYVTQTSSGFNLGVGASPYNVNTRTYVAWCWDESATPGFDIVTFNSGSAGNKTQAHSLGVAPAMIIVKSRDSSTFNWAVWHQSFATPTQGYLALNTTAAVANDLRQWANTAPTSTVFSYESGYTFTANQNIVAYLFSEVAGFSKFGSYTGNGSSDGPLVFCGFRPRWVLLKRTDAADDWSIYDTTRLTYNPQDLELFPNSSAAEYDGNRFVDILSNGFKLRIAGGAYNTSSSTVIFAAFAESPFKYSLAR